MPELRVLIGLPASGKTAYARDLMNREEFSNPWFRINWDDARKVRDVPFSRKAEDEMQKSTFIMAEEQGKKGWNIIVDNTNLNENTRNKWKGVAQRANMTYTEVRFDTPLQTCIERDAKREGDAQVGRAVIERMALFTGMIEFNANKYVIVDMDGTLADCSHRIHHVTGGNHNWDAFESMSMDDAPRQPIAGLVDILSNSGYAVLIVSGRQIGRAGKNTVKWLEKHCVPYKHIFMRQTGDNRPDNIVKQEILDKLPKDRIGYVLDDRNQVVKMWRDNGLTCLQVAPGDF